ncbi:MAG TPA: site-2 protease family protein [Candidatus Angelobacter sp.]
MRSWTIFGGRFFGVEFRIHVAFLFLLAVVLLFPSSRTGDPGGIARGVAVTAMVLVSVLLHELGHALAGARNGLPLKGSILLPIGGIGLADPNPPLDPAAAGSLGRELRVAAAGPSVNLLLAGVSGLVLVRLGPPASLWSLPLISIDGLGKSFFWINLCIFAVNLLPAFPLDGGRVLRAWLARRMEYRLATRRAVSLGHLFAAAFMLGGLASQWSLLMGFMLFMATQMEERAVMFQSVVETVHMEDVMLIHFSTLSPADTLVDALSKAVHSLQDDFPVVSGSDLVGVINRQTIVERLRREGNGYVQGAMNRAFETAARSESLASAFRKLTSHGLTLIPVVEQERLVGIVTLQNLMHSMNLFTESQRLRKRAEE